MDFPRAGNFYVTLIGIFMKGAGSLSIIICWLFRSLFSTWRAEWIFWELNYAGPQQVPNRQAAAFNPAAIDKHSCRWEWHPCRWQSNIPLSVQRRLAGLSLWPHALPSSLWPVIKSLLWSVADARRHACLDAGLICVYSCPFQLFRKKLNPEVVITWQWGVAGAGQRRWQDRQSGAGRDRASV